MQTNQPRKPVIVFDFDGTIGDTRALILSCFRATYERIELPFPGETEVGATIGLPLERAFAHLSGLGEEGSSRAAAVYRTVFSTLDPASVPPIPGMPEVVRRCAAAGLPLAVASSRGHASLDPMLRGLGLFDLFQTVVDHADAGSEKPDPAMLRVVARSLAKEPEELVMIGDTVYDIEMGRNAGSRTIAVSWGNHSRKALADVEPDLIVEEPSEILDYLGLEIGVI